MCVVWSISRARPKSVILITLVFKLEGSIRLDRRTVVCVCVCVCVCVRNSDTLAGVQPKPHPNYHVGTDRMAWRSSP